MKLYLLVHFRRWKKNRCEKKNHNFWNVFYLFFVKEFYEQYMYRVIMSPTELKMQHTIHLERKVGHLPRLFI
jgi:hypothetical protein